MPEVSVIIPVFKVERFAERCARALMEQTLQGAEFIFVDDASPDGSMDIIRRVVAEYPRRTVRFLVHPENKGLPAARNTGLKAASGNYIWHCDSDDYPEPEFLEKMYAAASRSKADMVYCDFYLDFGSSRKYMSTPDYAGPEQMIKEGFLAGQMKFNVWNKLISRSLYEKTGYLYPEGHSMGEDMTIIGIATAATSCYRVPEALYHYEKTNGNAFSNTFSQRHLDDILFNTHRAISFLDAWDVSDKALFTALFKLNVKLPFLFSGRYDQYRLWREWFPEANVYIRGNRYLPFRTRLVQQFAAWGLWPLVWLYAKGVGAYYKLKQD